MEVRRRAEGAAQRRAERQSGGCGAERSGRNWDQRLGILTFSRWCVGRQSRREGQSHGERSRRYSLRKSKQRDDAGAIGAPNRRPEGKVLGSAAGCPMTVGSAWQGLAPTMDMGADLGAAEMPHQRSWRRRARDANKHGGRGLHMNAGAYGMQIGGTSEKRNRTRYEQFLG